MKCPKCNIRTPFFWRFYVDYDEDLHFSYKCKSCEYEFIDQGKDKKQFLISSILMICAQFLAAFTSGYIMYSSTAILVLTVVYFVIFLPLKTNRND